MDFIAIGEGRVTGDDQPIPALQLALHRDVASHESIELHVDALGAPVADAKDEGAGTPGVEHRAQGDEEGVTGVHIEHQLGGHASGDLLVGVEVDGGGEQAAGTDRGVGDGDDLSGHGTLLSEGEEHVDGHVGVHGASDGFGQLDFELDGAVAGELDDWVTRRGNFTGLEADGGDGAVERRSQGGFGKKASGVTLLSDGGVAAGLEALDEGRGVFELSGRKCAGFVEVLDAFEVAVALSESSVDFGEGCIGGGEAELKLSRIEGSEQLAFLDALPGANVLGAESGGDGEREHRVFLGSGDAGNANGLGAVAGIDDVGFDESGGFGRGGASRRGGPGPERSGGDEQGEGEGDGDEARGEASIFDWPAGQFGIDRLGRGSRLGHGYVSRARMPSKKIFKTACR